MKLYSNNDNYKLYQGNMLDMLEVIKPNTIDSVVCDPPYELNFMGKGWDNSGIAFQVDTWKKCYEVLKPGGYLLAFGGSRTFHRIACAIEDAGFEIRDTIMWLYGCYSEDTQVLTQRGWLYFPEVQKKDKILQWNSETNELIWEAPKRFYEYDIDDEMVLFENRHTSQLVTKNHNMVLKIRKHSRLPKSNKWEIIKAQDVKKYWTIDFPLAGELKTGKKENHAYIIGWWLTDAWKCQNGKACMFSQSKPETLKKLKDGLDKENAQYSEYVKKPLKKEHKPEHTFYVRGELANYLLKYFPERKLTEEVLTWDEESRKELVRGLMDGDGSMQECRGYSRIFWSKNPERLDIFSALCITLNMRSYIDYKKGCVYFNKKRNTTQMEYRHRKPNQQYQGKVYCFETTTGAFVVRRKGKPFIGRNSGFPKSMSLSKGLEAREKLGNAGTRNKRKIEQACDTEEYTLKQTNNGAMGEIIETTRKQYIPDTLLAKQWQGWGTALKPSFEPIIVARKPFKGSLVDNVIEYGVGGINIDECRVAFNGDKWKNQKSGSTAKAFNLNEQQREAGTGVLAGYECEANENGRFPANTILTYDETPSDERLRYFYCAKASAKDRNEGLDIEIEEYVLKENTPKEIEQLILNSLTS